MSDRSEVSRRRFVLGATATLTLTATRGLADGGARPPMPAEPAELSPATAGGLLELTATEAVARMSRGELSAEKYAEALLARCAARGDLNAFISQDPELVREQARACDRTRSAGARPGLLFGLPIPVKDSVNTRDYATTGGTAALRNFHPAEDAPVVAALKQAGAIVLGKTNLHELSYGWTSNNLAFGAVHNPYDLSRIPGGSSGGTAAAVAARLAPLGIAEDTEGSIRVPAAFCGITGFRPTTGRYSTKGCVPISALFDQVGPHARSVADLALFDAVVARDGRPLTAPSLKGLRLGVVREAAFTDLDPDIERLTADALARLRAAGVVIVEATLPGLALLIDRTTYPVQNHDVRPALEHYLAEYGAGVDFQTLIDRASADIQAVFRTDVLPGGANVVSDTAYAAARDQYLPALRRLYRECFVRHRVAALVFPTTLVPPPRIGEETTVRAGTRELPFDVAVARNIAPGSTAGLPGLVMPIGLMPGGLPASLEFDGPAGGDRALLGLGLSLERLFGRLPAPPG